MTDTACFNKSTVHRLIVQVPDVRDRSVVVYQPTYLVQVFMKAALGASTRERILRSSALRTFDPRTDVGYHVSAWTCASQNKRD